MAVYNLTEQFGVTEAKRIFESEFSWAFRILPSPDFGIDAQVEVVEDGNPTGKLIALQIKTGASHFKDTGDELVYYVKPRHRKYWEDHSLPVILIAHLPTSKETFWVLVNSSTLKLAKTKWKISIPKKQLLSCNFRTQLLAIAEGTDEIQRHRKLLLDRSLMEIIRTGGSVSVEFDEWINKMLNHTRVTIVVSIDGVETVEREWGIMYAGYSNEQMMERLFPWADASVDEDFYEIHYEEDTLDGMYDIDKVREGTKLYPYNVLMSEVASFRVALSLNKLGEGFLEYMDFIEHG